MNIWRQLAKARKILNQGGVIGLPTETVYGLAALVNNPRGIRRIFEVKERPFFDPLIVHISNLEQVQSVVADWPPLADFLARKFWPGPMTLVLPKAKDIDSLICAGLDSVGIRMPRHPVALRLIESLRTPVAAPSANKFGKTSPTTAAHVRKEFDRENVFVLEGGPCEIGLESSVISVESSPSGDTLRIHRPGFVSDGDLKSVLQEWSRPVNIERAPHEASPGQLRDHYMPDIPLVVIDEHRELNNKSLSKIKKLLELPGTNYVEFQIQSEPVFAARELYSSMRLLASSRADLIIVRRRLQQTGGLWDAIWDRLIRAASLELTAID